MRDWRHTLLRAAVVPVVFMLLVVKQPDLGTAMVLAGVTAMMLILAGMEWKYLAGGLARRCPASPLCSSWFPGAAQRMLAFLHPDADPQGAGFHITQSLIAVGTGGLTGRGYMEGMQKLFYLPEAATDFIFANIAEELGFIGAMLIVLLFVVFGVRGLRAAFRSQRPVCAPGRLRHHHHHPAAGLLQHQRRAFAGSHQRHSPAAHFLGRNLTVLHPGQHRRVA